MNALRPDLQALADLARGASPRVVEVSYREREGAGLLVIELRDATPAELCEVHDRLRERCRRHALPPGESFVLVNAPSARGRPKGPVPDAWPPDPQSPPPP